MFWLNRAEYLAYTGIDQEKGGTVRFTRWLFCHNLILEVTSDKRKKEDGAGRQDASLVSGWQAPPAGVEHPSYKTNLDKHSETKVRERRNLSHDFHQNVVCISPDDKSYEVCDIWLAVMIHS